MKYTLEQILESEKQNRFEDGDFGVSACKDFIKTWRTNVDLYQLLKEYVDRANTDSCFNKAMVLACWELINNQ